MTEVQVSRRLLKANDIRGLGSKVAFNFEDMQARCDEYIEQVRAQARELVEKAQSEAESIRLIAHKEGLVEGRKEGLSRAEYKISQFAKGISEEKIQSTLPALQSAADILAAEKDRWWAQWEQAGLKLSVAIAEALLRKQLQIDPKLSQGMLAAALELAVGSPQIQVRMNPHDHKTLGPSAEGVVRSLSSCGEATVIPDESISPGGCVIKTQHGEIDARIETQLQRIVAELTDTST